jgi:hypothetical protein
VILQVLDTLVLLFGVSGAILLIYKKRLGFLSFIAHSVIWGILSIVSGNIGAAITCLVFICIDIFGYIKWGKENE